MMQSESEAPAAQKGGGKVRLLTLDDIDRRTTAYQRTRELIAAIESDLGGVEQLSTAEQQIGKRAAITSSMLDDLGAKWLQGEPVDPSLWATLSNAERRLYETIGLRKRPRDVTPDLHSYVARRAAAAPVDSVSASAGTAEAGADETLTSGHADAIAGQGA